MFSCLDLSYVHCSLSVCVAVSLLVLVSATIIMSYRAQQWALYEELHFYLSLYSFILFLSIEHYCHRLTATEEVGYILSVDILHNYILYILPVGIW